MRFLLITLWLWCALTGVAFSQTGFDPEALARRVVANLDAGQIPLNIFIGCALPELSPIIICSLFRRKPYFFSTFFPGKREK
jgi:hypothetical protein